MSAPSPDFGAFGASILLDQSRPIAYEPPPKTLPAFPDAINAKRTTPFAGGLRRRWKAPAGRIIEWDYQHGKIEVYDKNGKHQGEFDPNTGEQTKPAEPDRNIEK